MKSVFQDRGEASSDQAVTDYCAYSLIHFGFAGPLP